MHKLLVNKKNPVKDSFFKRIILIETKDIYNKDCLVEKETFEKYLELQKFLKQKKIIIGIESAYRSFESQKIIYTDFKNKNQEEYAAKPGYSEHQTGLALDINIMTNNTWTKDNASLFNQEKLFKEIHNHLYKFGFILRYPKDKEEITGYSYEPWHIRYVGPVVASIIYKNNWTLEEYKAKFSGVIAINKEEGMTSFDVVNEISRIFGIKKVGHTGTLDPLATGVLIVAIGQATKIVELLTALDKEYIAGVKLGLQTDTYDITGKVLKEKEIPNNYNLEAVLKTFKKTYLQEVPIYSAIKVNGRKLYEYARKNQQVNLPKKEVTIKSIELLDQNQTTFKFKALVTKGTYIRSLINDIGRSLNTYATMTSLTRTKQGKINIEETNTLEDIKNNHYKLSKIEEVLNYKKIVVDKALEFKIRNGQKLEDCWEIEDKVIFLNRENKLLGIYQKCNSDLKVWKNFNLH